MGVGVIQGGTRSEVDGGAAYIDGLEGRPVGPTVRRVGGVRDRDIGLFQFEVRIHAQRE